jgi:deaminated glutathione amidase
MRIAVLQMTSGIDPDVNCDLLIEALKDARAGGAVMLFTPEMSGLLDRNRTRAAARIKHEGHDPLLKAVRKAALDYGLWVQVGSLALRDDQNRDLLVNRGFLIDDHGNIVARYDKLHLFDVDLPTGESWRESVAYAPGQGAVVASAPVGSVGLSVCYDLRFPALYAALSLAGATLLSVPAAFTVPTGSAHWHTLLRARAIENACWLVAAAQTGQHEDGRQTYGHSLVVDPWGEVVLDMGTEAGLGFVEIDLLRVAEVRRRIPVIAHRRAIPKVSVIA